eukprot:TRINITY_DN4227_c0_g1_i3.p1 TRINITY_DN4227_c0_g1~~TRINITY_DN4227_c0_g1_i3.p1  ORF type:complete len:309 (+),score=74.14 TRINITY_DN4227_c0_g1_i3:85-1011(+)
MPRSRSASGGRRTWGRRADGRGPERPDEPPPRRRARSPSDEGPSRRKGRKERSEDEAPRRRGSRDRSEEQPRRRARSTSGKRRGDSGSPARGKRKGDSASPARGKRKGDSGSPARSRKRKADSPSRERGRRRADSGSRGRGRKRESSSESRGGSYKPNARLQEVIDELRDDDDRTRWLDLSNAGLVDRDAERLAEALEKYGDNLKGLYVHNNKLTDSGMKVIKRALAETNIQMINVSGNPKVSSEMADEMRNAVGRNCKHGKHWKGDSLVERRRKGEDGRAYARSVMGGSSRFSDRGGGYHSYNNPRR